MAVSNAAYAQDAVAVQPGNEAQTQAAGSPAEAAPRKLTFSVPLVSSSRAFGDVLIEVAGDGSVMVETASLQNELVQILNEEGVAALEQSTAGRAFIRPDELREAGFDVAFDSGQLELTVVSINPRYLKVRQLGQAITTRRGVELETIEPAQFSTYMNVTGNVDYDTGVGTDSPDFFFDGATRVGDFVVEYDGALTDQFSGTYGFFRRSTRLVYDEADSFRRYSAGDLRLNTLSVLRTPQIGGIALEKNRQLFDPALSITRLGGRQIFLDNRSTVDVLIDGVEFDTFQLDAGTYDLASLPIRQGSNDIQLVVRDSFGQRQVIDYNFFFEPLALPPGEEEYSFAVGVLSEDLGFEPSYTDEFAASGYYRKAFSENLILGGAFQASEEVQLLGATVSVVPQWIPGVFDVEAAGSTSSEGTGVAIRAGYRYQSGNALVGANQFSFDIDYESSGFSTIDNVLPINFDLLSISGSYSRSFSEDTFATAGGTYVSSGGRPIDEYTVFVDVNHRLSQRMRVTAGVEYGESTIFGSGFGVRVGLTVALGGRTRASADYRSRSENLRATLSRGADNQIGSFGYDLAFSRFGDDTQADAQVQYVSNRFEARADFTSSGDSFGGVFDDQRARLQIGTSFAFADGTFGIGRPINDSFLLAKSHPALEDNGVVTARTLARGNYYARSGFGGAAVQGDLSSYNETNIQFDAASATEAFDVGDGTVRVNPPYRSGYALQIGSEYFVSAIGVLSDGDGPVALAMGRITSVEPDENFEELPFFTNSSGRFGLFGLAPGRRYMVTLAGSGRTFIIDVPEQSDAVLRLNPITIPSVE